MWSTSGRKRLTDRKLRRYGRLSGSAVKLCNAYPNAALIPIHWGSVDAPDWSTFNGDPRELKKAIVNPDRLHVLVPGEAYTLSKNQGK